MKMARPYTNGEKAPTKATDARLRTSALASVTKPNPPDVPFYLTIADAARLLQSGTRPLYRAAKAGRLRVAKINDRGDLRTTLAWLEAYVDSCAR